MVLSDLNEIIRTENELLIITMKIEVYFEQQKKHILIKLMRMLENMNQKSID
jgi:hypothetical protein